jgi:hypothetical protein
MCWVGGVYASITGFCNWNQLSDIQKGNLITGVIEQFGKLVESVPDLVNTGAWVGTKAMNIIENAYEYFSEINTIDDLAAACEACDSNWLYIGAKNIQGFFNVAKGAIETDGTFFASFFKALPTIMKFLGAAVAVAFAALATWQFIDDLMNGAPTVQTAFDGVIMAASIVAAVCAVVEIAVDLVFVAVLGPVAAVIGAIFAIVELFLPKPKVVSPVDEFMDGTLRPFADKLPSMPSGWTPPGTVSGGTGQLATAGAIA